MDPEKIGKFIYELRKEKNLSQYQLADLIPITRQGVSKWERGKTTPDPQTLLRLSELFDVSINELLKGEKLQNNTIEDLEETTLSILDQSNKKTKTIKRITTISISIIIILLLSFLSYYFINSYNTTEVYTIYGQGNDFTTTDGLMIITKERIYIKIGQLKNKNDYEIENLTLFYKNKNKRVIMAKDKDADNLILKEDIGYYEKVKLNNGKGLINNMYLEIVYKDNKKETLKLKLIKDFSNNSLFFLNQKNGKTEKLVEEVNKKTETPLEEKKEEKEETKPTIQEETHQESKPTPTETPKQEEPAPQEPQPEQPQELIITKDMVINKITETCENTNGSYTCNYEDSSIAITYHAIMNKITLYKNGNLIGHYLAGANNYMCFVDDCETVFNEIYKEYLFK